MITLCTMYRDTSAATMTSLYDLCLLVWPVVFFGRACGVAGTGSAWHTAVVLLFRVLELFRGFIKWVVDDALEIRERGLKRIDVVGERKTSTGCSGYC